MKQLVEYELSDKSKILLEVDEPKTTSSLKAVSRNGTKITEAKETFEQALEKIKPMIEDIKGKFVDMEDSADEVEVKFGVKLSGQVGAIITVGGEASYEITMRWKKN